MELAEFTRMVDHTLLTPEATRAQVEQLCEEARELRTAAVCVNGLWVPLVRERLAGSDVLTCSVVGFPFGAMAADAVAEETVQVVEAGAQEVDMVLPLGLHRGGQTAGVEAVLAAVRRAADGVVLKVILESALLSEAETVAACRLAEEAGADFVKTSTGFHPAGGATVEAVELMRETVGDRLGVKASGGIRSLADAEAMVAAGATRLGLSRTPAIAAELG